MLDFVRKTFNIVISLKNYVLKGIDFSVHVTHAFIGSKGSRNERAYQACIETGIPILNSATSTIIGVSVMGFASSYAFKSFFKTLILIMFLGVFSSMLFLPVLLSTIGPNWKMHKKKYVPMFL